MIGWLLDVLVGWIVGSVVLGLAAGVLAAVLGVSSDAEAAMNSVAIVVGTIGGIWLMRKRRADQAKSADAGATEASPPGRRWLDPRRPRTWIVAGLLALFVVVILNAALNDDQSDARKAAQTLGASESVRGSDLDIVDNLSQFLSKWNEAATPLVRDYIDENVSGDEWLETAGASIPEMDSARAGQRRAIESIRDSGLRVTFLPMAENYDAKFEAVTSLREAVRSGDTDAQEEAAQRMTRLGEEGQRLASELLDKLASISPEAKRYVEQRRAQMERELGVP